MSEIRKSFFLFPYEKVPKGSNIILYGAGMVGNSFYVQCLETGYVTVKKWVDKNFVGLCELGYPIEDPEMDYRELEFDWIVIAVNSEEVANDIKKYLLGKDVVEEKIIWKKPELTYSYVVKEVKEEKTTKFKYSDEKNVQYLIALLKAHGIRKVVVSPGATNISFVGSIQNDPFFEIYSAVDERSAAYMACGLAAESNEVVVLSCTGATASRNYMPGLTEAYYRNLPVLAVTSSQYFGRVGNNVAQMIDRRNEPNDVMKYQARLSTVYSEEDEWFCQLEINRAVLELKRNGGGAVHIDLETTYSQDFSVEELPEVVKIDRYGYEEELPFLNDARVAIVIGSHVEMSEQLTQTLSLFCEKYNAVVLADRISNYRGTNAVCSALVCSQSQYQEICTQIDILIHIGETTAYSFMGLMPNEVWRVHPDGEVRDLFHRLTKVFAMKEEDFFSYYLKKEKNVFFENMIYKAWKEADELIRNKITELPFSNAWIAQMSMNSFHQNSVLHLGILNTLRVWNLFPSRNYIPTFANTGGFGIDGCMSSLIGASLANPKKIHFGILGDLAFFYDMNVVGNRHVGNNVRIMLINNGKGAEFRIFNHTANRFGDDADDYMAAAGHYGAQSRNLVKNYAENLGYMYIKAEDKEEYLKNAISFFSPQQIERPVLFEVFTDYRDESKAIEMLYNLTKQ